MHCLNISSNTREKFPADDFSGHGRLPPSVAFFF